MDGVFLFRDGLDRGFAEDDLPSGMLSTDDGRLPQIRRIGKSSASIFRYLRINLRWAELGGLALQARCPVWLAASSLRL